ncbi:c-type cytochrome [Emticicia agri]|uniref:Cytochrome c n=1 Tax=Emticicia agri TaxID=2492393 RepID=A0A4V1ZD48_9BACT|nr:cytochrome c [Emticicia agri]RYU94910.1 cytochrome c [Emticicia agri]
MDVQKTIVKVLELFKTLAILYGFSWVIFASTAFYYFNQDKPPQKLSDAQVIDYIENKPLSLSETATKGKALFTEYCGQCHTTSDEVVVGPGLKGIQERQKITWLREWIRNSPKLIASGDKYAVELFQKFNRTPMSTFPQLKDEDIDAILKYVEEVNQ